MINRLKTTQVTAARTKIAKEQGNICPLCEQRFGARKKPALDHDHDTGYLRGVLCINCNGMEGKITNRVKRAKGTMSKVQWLRNLLAYWELHETPQWGGIYHPSHKSEEEKRLARNAKARAKRAAAKAAPQ